MTIYVVAYAACLTASGAMSYSMGEDRDRITWAALAVAAVLSHYSLTFGIKTAIGLHGVAYMMMALASLILATRLHADIIGCTFAVSSMLAFMAMGGVIPYAAGQGISWNFWNLHTIVFYGANIALMIGVWRRYYVF